MGASVVVLTLVAEMPSPELSSVGIIVTPARSHEPPERMSRLERNLIVVWFAFGVTIAKTKQRCLLLDSMGVRLVASFFGSVDIGLVPVNQLPSPSPVEVNRIPASQSTRRHPPLAAAP